MFFLLRIWNAGPYQNDNYELFLKQLFQYQKVANNNKLAPKFNGCSV
jgi:hypothetical protein